MRKFDLCGSHCAGNSISTGPHALTLRRSEDMLSTDADGARTACRPGIGTHLAIGSLEF
jgi:hypothetical protein